MNVQFSSAFWTTPGSNGETYADTGYQNTWEVSRAQSGKSGILVEYTGGSAALALGGKTATALVFQFLPRIEPVLPSIEAQGYLNGAVESGERVSREILADFKALA